MEDLRLFPVLCVLLFLLVNGVHGALSRKRRLAGGEVGLYSGDRYPFHVKVYYTKPWGSAGLPECQGVLYTENYVLTVAHCLHSESEIGFRYVTCGNQLIRVQQTIIHPDFTNSYPPVLPNDIALLKLDTTFSLGDNDQCATASLPDNTGDFFYGLTGYVVSWAGDSGTVGPLKKDKFEVLTVSECNQKQDFGSLLDSSVHLCGISFYRTASLCSGDAGMPFILEGSDKVIGLGSWFVDKECENSKPGVFTRVANYVDWVNHVISDVGVGSLPDNHGGSIPNVLPDS